MLSTPVRTLSASKCPPRRPAYLHSGIQTRSKAKNLSSEALPPPTPMPTSEWKVCTVCRTSMTPLWRKGPNGPKSLCNACGIRYRKRRPERGNEASKTKVTKSSDGRGARARAMSAEVLQRKQREKQERMLLLQFQSRDSVEGDGGGGGGAVYGKNEMEAALLLMSLSAGIFVHSQ